MVIDSWMFLKSHLQWTFTNGQRFVGGWVCLYTRAVCKFRRLAAVRRCYADGGGDLCQVVAVRIT